MAEALSAAGLWAVIPVHNRKAETLACLERLKELRAEAPGLRVLVADDGSTDGTAEAIAQSYPDTVVVHGHGDWWWTGAMRAGVDEALRQGATAILSLNDDTLLEPGSLARLWRSAAEHPRTLVSALGAHEDGVVIESGYRWVGLKGWTVMHRLPGWDGSRERAPYPAEAVAGACVIIPAEAFRTVGNYSAALPHYHADIELSARCTRAGFGLLMDPGARLMIRTNLKNADLLGGQLSLKRLRWMFSYPGGAYHPAIVLAFYTSSHPWGRVAGALYTAFFFVKIGLQLALNALGLGSRLRA